MDLRTIYVARQATVATLLSDDNLMNECSTDQPMSELFTRNSHHRGTSVTYLTQSLFPLVNMQSRTISLNSYYMIVFKNPRDSPGITALSRQMYPRNVNYLFKSFHDAASKPYGYTVMDLQQLTPENMRQKTNIFRGGPRLLQLLQMLQSKFPGNN